MEPTGGAASGEVWLARCEVVAVEPNGHGGPMIVLGAILLIIGFVTGIAILWTIGIILVVIGLILALLGSAGRMVGPRRHYW